VMAKLPRSMLRRPAVPGPKPALLPRLLWLLPLPSSCSSVMPGITTVSGRGPGWPHTPSLLSCLQPLAQAASTGAGGMRGAITSCVRDPRDERRDSSRAEDSSQPGSNLSKRAEDTGSDHHQPFKLAAQGCVCACKRPHRGIRCSPCCNFVFGLHIYCYCYMVQDLHQLTSVA
jgi:hypothetical protein